MTILGDEALRPLRCRSRKYGAEVAGGKVVEGLETANQVDAG